jgi:hypothetical protein
MAAGAYIFEGLKSIGESFERKQEEEKLRARRFKSLVEYADAAGIMSKDQAIAMDVDSLEGEVQGWAAKQNYDRTLAQVKAYQAQLAAAEQATRASQQIGPGLASFFENISPTTTFQDLQQYYDTTSREQEYVRPTGPGRMTPEAAVAELAKKYPAALASPQFDNTLAAIQKLTTYGEGGREGFTKAELGVPRPVPGIEATFAIPTSSQQVQITKAKPSGAKAGATPVYDESKQLLGHWVASGDGETHWVPEAKPQTGMIELPDPNDPIYGPRIRLPISVAKRDYPHLLKRLEPGTAAAVTAAGTQQDPLPQPARIEDAQVNKWYSTNKGVLRWDGQRFVKK